MSKNQAQSVVDFHSAVLAVKQGYVSAATASQSLLSRLTVDEKLWLLDGDEDFWPGMYDLVTNGFCHVPYILGKLDRLGIPGVRFCDGPRGCVMGKSTDFPVPMARGATWDSSLEKRVGRAIGRECSAQGANLFGGVCVNLPRHPAWGRVQETYGEDPVLLGQMGTALMVGVQENLMAAVKHFALNSTEESRFSVDVDVDEDVLHEIYLPHFRHIVEKGVAVVMSSYNSVRGEFAGQSADLLQKILREQWKFDGFVISDFLFGFRDPGLSLKSGLDLEAPFRQQRALHLKSLLHEGKVSNTDVDRAGTAILARQLEHYAFRGDRTPDLQVINSAEHRELAKEAAVKSMTLLKNQDIGGVPLLPLQDISSIAVVGRLANFANTGDKGSSAVRCPDVVSPYQGIAATFPECKVSLEISSDPKKVRQAALDAQIVVVVVGYTFRDEGECTAPAFNGTPGLQSVIPPNDMTKEANSVITRLMTPQPSKAESGSDNYGWGTGGDRSSLGLRAEDVRVIRAATDANVRTIVCVVSGGAVIIEEWKDLPQAIIFSWYSGCEGGNALADLLRGRENFSGRLPFSIPTSEEHLPYFDKNATRLRYDRWFGQRLLDRLQVPAAYPLGYGLSYTKFALEAMEVHTDGDDRENIVVRALVSNEGNRAGRFVAQVYGTVSLDDWPKRSLLGFSGVDVDVGGKMIVCVNASLRPMQRWSYGDWKPVSQEIQVEVGAFSGDGSSLKQRYTLR